MGYSQPQWLIDPGGKLNHLEGAEVHITDPATKSEFVIVAVPYKEDPTLFQIGFTVVDYNGEPPIIFDLRGEFKNNELVGVILPPDAFDPSAPWYTFTGCMRHNMSSDGWFFGGIVGTIAAGLGATVAPYAAVAAGTLTISCGVAAAYLATY